MNVKIFQLNDCDWWAAESLQDAKDDYIATVGDDYEFDNPHELDEVTMDRLRFYEEDGSYRTFARELRRRIKSGQKFPCFFASTEW